MGLHARVRPDAGGLGLVGGPDFLGFAGVTGAPDPRYSATIPHVLFATFQLMFAAITPALITGAFAERKRFAAFVIFTVLWSTFVYSPLAHWVWAPGGWRSLGALDFAGGTVVHISSGVSAFVVAWLIGRRATGEEMEPHDVPMTVLGAGCSGSAGSGSTPAPRWRRTARRRTRCWSRTPRPARRR